MKYITTQNNNGNHKIHDGLVVKVRDNKVMIEEQQGFGDEINRIFVYTPEAAKEIAQMLLAWAYR